MLRWLSYNKAITTLRKCLPSVYTSLECEAENDLRAAGLSKFKQNYQFVLTLHMMCDVLPNLSDLSKVMQKRDAIYPCIKPLVCGILVDLQCLLTTPGSYFKAAPESSQSSDRRLQYHCPSQSRLTSSLTRCTSHSFTSLSQTLKSTFQTCRNRSFSKCLTQQNSLKELANHFNLPVENTVYNWQQVCGSLHGTSKNTDKAMEWVSTNLKASHDHLHKLAAVDLLLLSSNADFKRGLTTMHKIRSEND